MIEVRMREDLESLMGGGVGVVERRWVRWAEFVLTWFGSQKGRVTKVGFMTGWPKGFLTVKMNERSVLKYVGRDVREQVFDKGVIDGLMVDVGRGLDGWRDVGFLFLIMSWMGEEGRWRHLWRVRWCGWFWGWDPRVRIWWLSSQGWVRWADGLRLSVVWVYGSDGWMNEVRRDPSIDSKVVLRFHWYLIGSCLVEHGPSWLRVGGGWWWDWSWIWSDVLVVKERAGVVWDQTVDQQTVIERDWSRWESIERIDSGGMRLSAEVEDENEGTARGWFLVHQKA